MIEYLNTDGDTPFSICELQSIGEEIKKDLKKPSWVTQDWVDEAQIYLTVDARFQVYLSLSCTEPKHLECFEHRVSETKVAVG